MKLRFAAVVLGCTTRKELALAFRSINPETSFDVERADMWLSGRLCRVAATSIATGAGCSTSIGHSSGWPPVRLRSWPMS